MRNDIILASLSEQILTADQKLLTAQLEEFCCARDKDVETFLHKRAIDYEESGLSRTFLYFGGKVAYLDCREHLVDYYTKYGYQPLRQTPSDTGLYKMFRVLPKLSREV